MTCRRVLVVEDDADVCLMFTLALNAAGFAADGERDAERAMAVLGSYDALVTDYRLRSRFNGLDLARAYKAARPDGFVALASGMDRQPSEDVDAQFVKPINLEALVRTLRRLCRCREVA